MVETMTREQIEQMPAGPEINTLIQTEIYQAVPLSDEEWQLVRTAWLITSPSWITTRPLKVPTKEPCQDTGAMYRLGFPQDFSRDDQSAASLVHRMRRDGWLFSLYEVPGSGVETLRIAAFEKLPHSNMRGCQGTAEAHTDALAISRAALKAKIADAALNRRDDVRVTSPQHPFKGCLDRPCETCGLPDRAWIHSGERPVLYERGEK